jgi:hypothetical protein
LARADWVLVVTTVAADWSLTDVLRLYRARWQVELVCKRMQQLLRCNQLRSTHRTTVEATVRALLIAWAWQDGLVAELRALFPTAQSGASLDVPLVVSTGSLVGLGLETRRHQVQQRWSLARLRTCLPRLRRLLCSRPRRREHQETAVRAWLEGRCCACERCGRMGTARSPGRFIWIASTNALMPHGWTRSPKRATRRVPAGFLTWRLSSERRRKRATPK